MRRFTRAHHCSLRIKTNRPCPLGHAWKERRPPSLRTNATRRIWTFGDDDWWYTTTWNHSLIHNLDISYADMVDKYFMTPAFLNECIKGTNDHAVRKRDDKYEPISLDKSGRNTIRLYWAIEIAMSDNNKTQKEFWSPDPSKGIHKLCRLGMNEKRFLQIRRNFCMNEDMDFTRNKRSHNYNRYCDWEGGIQILLQNSRKAIDKKVNFKVIDEARMIETAAPGTSVEPKPDRKGVNVYTVCVRFRHHKGYTIGAKAYNKNNNRDEDIVIEEKEGDTDNLVNQLITQTSDRDNPNSVYVADSKFNSVYVHETLANAKNTRNIGVINSVAAHLPNSHDTRKTRFGYFEQQEWKDRVKAMEKGEYMKFESGQLHLTVFRSRKKPVYILDNCVNPNKLDYIESCGETYLGDRK